jgi:hypothetical protein
MVLRSGNKYRILSTNLAIRSEDTPAEMAPAERNNGTIQMSSTPFTKMKIQHVKIVLKKTLT